MLWRSCLRYTLVCAGGDNAAEGVIWPLRFSARFAMRRAERGTNGKWDIVLDKVCDLVCGTPRLILEFPSYRS